MSFLMGKVMLSMNTHPLPHTLVSVEIHSKPPDLIEQMLPAKPLSARGQSVVTVHWKVSLHLSPSRAPQHSWLPLVGTIPQHVLCPANSYKFLQEGCGLVSQQGAGRGVGTGDRKERKDLMWQLSGLAPDLASK